MVLSIAGVEGFEPSTLRLTVECSAVELHATKKQLYSKDNNFATPYRDIIYASN